MALLGSLYLAFFLLFLGHSTLLHYHAEESRGTPIPASRILLPSPIQGRLGAALAFVVAFVFLAFALIQLMSPQTSLEKGDLAKSLPVAMIFVVFPLAFYAVHIGRRLTRNMPDRMGQWMFIPKPASRAEATVPLLLAAVINFISYLIRHFA
nr:hypothetical protein [uncultured Massilia sp.]